MRKSRPSVPRSVQVEVFFRDGWLCHLCRRPTVFPLALKLLEQSTRRDMPEVALAMYDERWSRDKAPLLDELGACVDHVEAYSRGGAHDASNFATACARCNARKSARSKEEYLESATPWAVRGKRGEPQHWDGLAAVFVALARQSKDDLTVAERDWLTALEEHYTVGGTRRTEPATERPG